MSRRLHRSLTFWSGLLVFAFIFWAWRDSFARSHSLRYCSIPNLYTAVHIEGELFLLHWDIVPAGSVPPGWHGETTPISRDYSKKILTRWWTPDYGVVFRFTLSDVAVLAGFSLGWFSLLLWRARRCGQRANPLAGGCPEQET